MKKRLRKKKHFGEFKELGFEVRGDLRPGLSGNDLEAFVDRLIEIVEARSLAFGRLLDILSRANLTLPSDPLRRRLRFRSQIS